MRHVRLLVVAVLATPLAVAAQSGVKITPAPDGEPAMVAQKKIHEDFEKADCPLVVDARRFGDGSITATCNNGETFRVFTLNGKAVALRCSVAKALGISGC